MNTDKLIKENFALQQKLTPENEQYYGDFLVYIRSHTLLKDDQKTEEILLEIIQDILDAQNKGISASEYFGKAPKEIADEIIRQIPFNIKDLFKLLGYGLGAYTLFSLLPSLVIPDKPLDVGTFLVVATYSTAIAFLIFWLIGKEIYRPKNKLMHLLSVIGFIVLFSIGFFLNYSIHTPFLLKLEGTVGIVFILVLISCLVIFLFKTDERKLWFPMLPIVLVCAVWGIVGRMAHFQVFMTSKAGQPILIFLLLGALLLQYLFLFLVMRNKKTSAKTK